MPGVKATTAAVVFITLEQRWGKPRQKVSPKLLHIHNREGRGDLRPLSQMPCFELGSEPECSQGIR